MLAASAKSASVRPPSECVERQSQLVPTVHQDVRVMVGRFGQLGNSIDQRDRLSEVGELQVAHDRIAVATPLRAAEVLLYLRLSQHRHRAPSISRLVAGGRASAVGERVVWREA